MKAAYLRFVVGTEADDPAWLTGPFSIARELRDEGELDYRDECDRSGLDQIFAWFNENLPNARPSDRNLRSGTWSPDAVAWFRSGAKECLGRIRDLIAILEEHGTPVRTITAKDPGKIVYSDKYQIVAETPRWGRLR